ncbi:MAG: hypothetical protein HWE22_16295 [Flavobacteriales bacterium]|nr:hypothetical protein [Flavobacteriales bacterium]
MKNILLILFCGLQSLVFSHDFYFSFAELEYNDISQRFESTVSVSSHDLERIFYEKGWSIDDLENESNNANFEAISQWVLNQYTLTVGEQQVDLSIIGCEIELTGLIYFYIESKPIEIGDLISVKFNLLMDEFPEQQNKLTFYYRDQTITKSFLQNAFVQEIKLENS